MLISDLKAYFRETALKQRFKIPVVGGPDMNFMKRKKASSKYDTKQCQNRTIQRMAFKGTIAPFSVKES